MNQVDGCLRHRRYGTEAGARAAARRQPRRNLSPWRCKVGGELHWHIGHGKRR